MDSKALQFLSDILQHRDRTPLIVFGFGCGLIVIFFIINPIGKLAIAGTDVDLKFLNLLFGAIGLVVAFFGLWQLVQRHRVTEIKLELPAPWKAPISRIQCVRNNNCDVLHSVNPLEYSELAAEFANLTETRTIFTVCGIEPRYLIRELEKKRTNIECADAFSLDPLRALGAKGIQDLADSSFPHFAAFRTFHERRRGRIIRILLDTGNGWMARNKDVLELFQWLNGDIDCFVVNTQHLRARDHNIHFITDFVVFNSELFVDYYDDSETLLVTLTSDGQIKSQFMGLENNFQRLRATPLYSKL